MNKYLIVLSLLLASCVTQRRCLERFPPQIVTRDSIVERIVTVYHDTIITVKLPADTVWKEVDLDSLLAPLVAENKYAKAVAEVYKNKLKLTLVQKDTEIAFKLDSARKETSYWKEKWETDKQTVTVETKYIPGVYRAAFWILLGEVLIIVLYILYKVFKPKIL
jgi:hypothetical protein